MMDQVGVFDVRAVICRSAACACTNLTKAITKGGDVAILSRPFMRPAKTSMTLLVDGDHLFRFSIVDSNSKAMAGQVASYSFQTARQAQAFITAMYQAQTRGKQESLFGPNSPFRLTGGLGGALVAVGIIGALAVTTHLGGGQPRPAPMPALSPMADMRHLSPDVMSGIMDIASGGKAGDADTRQRIEALIGKLPDYQKKAEAGHLPLPLKRDHALSPAPAADDIAIATSVSPKIPVALPDVPKGTPTTGGNELQPAPGFSPAMEAHDFQDTGRESDRRDQIEAEINRLRGVEDIIPGGDYSSYHDLKAVLPDLSGKKTAPAATQP